jgi:hypothetical protein
MKSLISQPILRIYVADRVGFEPTVPVRARRFSKPLVSATHSSVQLCQYKRNVGKNIVLLIGLKYDNLRKLDTRQSADLCDSSKSETECDGASRGRGKF